MAIAVRQRSTTPADIPANRVTGTPTLAQRQGDELSYAVPTDAGTLTVTVVVQDGQWKVRRSGLRTPGAVTDPGAPQPKPGASGNHPIRVDRARTNPA